jgi:hypothetical protein
MDVLDENPEEAIPRFHEEVGADELVTGLSSLVLLRDDLAMSSQAFNLAAVDKFLMALEMDFLRSRYDEDRPRNPEQSVFLSAQTEMWLFAAYELLRSWRERAKFILKLNDNGGLGLKIEHLQGKPAWDHGSQMVCRQLARVRDDPGLVVRLREDLLRSHIPFHLLEWVRVQLAKYQEPGNNKAFVRSHPMMDRWTGSLTYELTQGPVIAHTLSRRNLADMLRAIGDGPAPPEDVIASFEAFRKIKPPPFDD